MKTLIALSLTLLIGFPATVLAGLPTDQTKATVDAVLETVLDKSMDTAARETKVRELIRERFDFTAMSRRVLGPEWKKATPEQQQKFIGLFEELLAQTYLVAIEQYTDEEVQYVKETIKKERFAQVDTLIVRGNIKTPINYRLYLRDGNWYVYDAVIEGVSLINNYRSSYPSIVAREGMDVLLDRMRARVDCNSGTC